jgi:2-keto-4-pentenoate hydratase/2-oxohepta-3-ene-1,7-dioic acid hydratase in catechol pathway
VIDMQLKLVTFTPKTGPCPGVLRAGVLADDTVYDLQALGAETACCAELASVACILASDGALATARGIADECAAGQAPDGTWWHLGDVKLEAPILRPGKLLALAGNYAEHIMESTSKKLQGTGVTKSDMATPRIFMKPPANTVCGPGDPIIVGEGATFVDWEAEMGLIIGKPGKCIDRDEALAHVGGITIVNDVSERELKIWDRPEDREWDRFFDWLNGKWCDSFAPMGPCAVPLADVEDLDRLRIRLWVNDELKQDASTGQMIFKAEDILAYASSICTLHTGDVIATGTPSGVGHAQGVRLQPGDVVRIELEGVGVLESPVVAEG